MASASVFPCTWRYTKIKETFDGEKESLHVVFMIISLRETKVHSRHSFSASLLALLHFFFTEEIEITTHRGLIKELFSLERFAQSTPWPENF